MATDMITLKLEDKFLEDIDAVVEKEGYKNRTEFIRRALREKLEESKIKEAMLELAHLKGASKKRTTVEQYEKARRFAFEKLEKMAK